MYKIYCFVLLLCLVGNVAIAQTIDNKLDVYGGFGLANSSGNAYFQQGSYSTPTLLPNMHAGYTISMSVCYQVWPFFKIGAGMGKTRFSKWQLEENQEIYKAADLRILSFSPILKFQTPYRNQGIFNRIKFYTGVNPEFNSVKLNLRRSIFEVQSIVKQEEMTPEYLKSSRKKFPGLEVVLGVEYAFSDRVGVFLNLGYHYFNTSDILYPDSQFMYQTVQTGLFFRYLYNKRFYY